MVSGLAELGEYVQQNLKAKRFPLRHPDDIFATFKRYSISAPKSEKQYENCIKNINWLRSNPEKVKLLEQRSAERRASRSPSYRGRGSPPYSPIYRGRGSPPHRGRGSFNYRGRGSHSWRGRGSQPNRVGGSPRGRGSPTYRGRSALGHRSRGRGGQGRYGGTYRGRGDGLRAFNLSPSSIPEHEQRGRGGKFFRSRGRGSRAKGQSRSAARWSNIEKKITLLEQRMSALYRKKGLTLPNGSMSFQQFLNLTSPKKPLSIKDCYKVLDVAVKKLKKVDKIVTEEFTNLGLSRKKPPVKKELTEVEVHKVQLRAYKRITAVVKQAIKLGIHVGHSSKAL